MKKFLSVLLAVMMVLSTIVMAAPSAVTGFDTAKEETDDSADAELAATASIYNIRYFAIGNSYLMYPRDSSDHVQWWMDYDGNNETRGMAASAPDKDYFRQIQKGIKDNFNVTMATDYMSAATAEPSWKQGLTDSSNYKSFVQADGAAALDTAYAPIMEKIANFQPNVITLQVGENTGLSASWDCPAQWYYTYLIQMIRKTAPDAVIVLITSFDKDSVVQKGQQAAFNALKGNDSKLYMANNEEALGLGWNETKTYTSNDIGVADYLYESPYLAYKTYPAYDDVIKAGGKNSDGKWNVTDFRAHPGDEGMKFIADNVVAQLKNAIPAWITPNLVEIPTTLGTIHHDRTTADGKAVLEGSSGNVEGKFYLMPSEIKPDGLSDVSKEVVWTIDNEEIATGTISTDVSGNSANLGITELFVVKPKRNGPAKITVASKYDSSIYAEIEIEVKGRAPHYTLTYNAGTDDASVKNIPASYAYAAEEYVFPTPSTIPTRDGYKFAGWSESKGGKAVDSVYMNEDTTVYAVWEHATDWQFNTPGNDEGINYGGMHGKVVEEDGVGYATATTFNSGAAFIEAKNLLIPADSYKTFKTRLSLSTVNSGDKIELVITTKENGTRTFNAPISAANVFTEVTFDLSAVEGTITGFKVGSSNADIDTNVIKVDYATFVEDKTALVGDKTFTNHTTSGIEVYNSGNNKYTFTNLTVDSGASIYFGTGNYEINGVTNNGEILAAPDANVVITGGTVDGYVEINIGTKTNAVRYAEVDGVEHKIKESAGNTKYGMIVSNDVDRLLQIGDGTNTSYYFIDASAETYREITGLKGFMHKTNAKYDFGNDGGKYGAKFESYVNTSAKEESTAYTITEYGYIVSIDELLGADHLNFNLDATKYAYGAAYAKGVSDKVVTSTDSSVTSTQNAFRAVIYGAPEAGYGKKLVVKTYTKLVVEGQEFIVYGETQYESFYSLAKQLDANNEIVKDIIGKTEDNSTDGPTLDFGDLLG